MVYFNNYVLLYSLVLCLSFHVMSIGGANDRDLTVATW